MREVDEVHDPEDEREPGRDQEQRHAELEPVERLLDKEEEGHRLVAPGRVPAGPRARVAPGEPRMAPPQGFMRHWPA